MYVSDTTTEILCGNLDIIFCHYDICVVTNENVFQRYNRWQMPNNSNVSSSVHLLYVYKIHNKFDTIYIMWKLLSSTTRTWWIWLLHSNLTCFFPIKYTCIQQTDLVFYFIIYFTVQLLEKLDNIIAYFHDWTHFILLFLQKNTCILLHFVCKGNCCSLLVYG